MKYFFFAFEVEIDSAVSYPRLAGNIGDLGTEVPVVREDLNGRAENRLLIEQKRAARNGIRESGSDSVGRGDEPRRSEDLVFPVGRWQCSGSQQPAPLHSDASLLDAV